MREVARKKEEKGEEQRDRGREECTSQSQSHAPLSVSFFNNAPASKYASLIVCKARSWPLRSAQ